MKTWRKLPLVIFVLALGVWLGGSLVLADEVQSPLGIATEDTYIDSAGAEAGNPHNGQKLGVVSYANDCVKQVTYLKFNVGTGVPISNWELRLYAAESNLNSQIGVFGVANTWAEGTLTYTQAGTLGIIPKTAACGGPDVALTTQTMSGSAGYVSWPKTTAFDAYVNNARCPTCSGIVSLALAHVTPNPQFPPLWINVFCDKETAGVTPCPSGSEPLPVSLLAFDATGGGRAVTLEWVTASEVDTEGFNLYRSEAEDGEYVKINGALIPAQGNPSTGASYSFTDTDVKPARTYYYKLEDVDTSGASTFHGPVSATVRGKGR